MKAFIFLITSILYFISFTNHLSAADHKVKSGDVVIENAEMCLVLSPDGRAISLKHKHTGQECLEKGTETPVFAITEYRPYDNELFLIYPAKSRTFAADSIRRVGNELKVGFEQIAYTATIALNITDDYIGFTLKSLDYQIEAFGVKRRTEVDEFTLLQLPVKKRKFFGEWLNVVWDDKVAVNILATDPYAKIDGFRNKSHYLLYAGMENKVKLMGVGAALITTSKDKLLDRIDRLEKDYKLPQGVESRRSEAYKYSYYELRNVTPQNIDEHIAFAKQGGFRAMVIYYPDFAKSMGHFPWRPEYPNGMADLQAITQKIRVASMIPGFHIHYSKTAKDDPYVSPVPDARLNLVRIFTLTDSIETRTTNITVEENPEGCTMEEGRRFLKLGNELVTYEQYTTTPPYRFTGCRRGELGTKIKEVEKGFKFGLLDVDTWPLFIRFDQNTSIQQEVAERIGQIYADAGFQFVYFDGAEDVNPPYWHTVSKSQLLVYNSLKPEPLFSEGALKSHFGWHILSRANAFDLFRPEVIRQATQKYPMAEAKYIAQDFTSINFGWNDYLAPTEKSTGMQPDMYEYICSRGAAWDCPIALMGKLIQLRAHPRTNDNLEVIKNWEEARIQKFFTQRQKEALQDHGQEHTLLVNEAGKFELIPYEPVANIANHAADIRAFMFVRKGKTWVVYWHVRGEGLLRLPINAGKLHLLEKPGKEISVAQKSDNYSVVPVDNRRYMVFDVPQKQVKSILSKAELLKK